MGSHLQPLYQKPHHFHLGLGQDLVQCLHLAPTSGGVLENSPFALRNLALSMELGVHNNSLNAQLEYTKGCSLQQDQKEHSSFL